MGDFYIALIAANFDKIVANDLRKNRVWGEISILLLLWLILRECQRTECKGNCFIGYFYIALIVAHFEGMAEKRS